MLNGLLMKAGTELIKKGTMGLLGGKVLSAVVIAASIGSLGMTEVGKALVNVATKK